MTCCAPVDVQAAFGDTGQSGSTLDEIRLASRDLGDGTRQTDLSVPGVRCAACIAAVERTLARLPGVERARVNLSTKRVAVAWRTADGAPPDLIGALRGIGYEAHLFALDQDAKDPELARLVKALAVAGFCAMNIMMLSVSVWSGADASSRQAFHLISALLALPALLYSGRIFYASAWSALRHGRTNMDVPISIGVPLAFALSLYDTLHNAPHAYFDAATSLLFFLLIGRTLDHVMRERARSAVAGLARLAPRGATILRDGRPLYVPVSEIEPGAMVLVAAGERVPVDGVVEHGMSELDCSLVSGESALRRIAPGETVQAGVMNLTGPLTVRATARAEESFLAEMVRMMEAAEGGRARYRRLADRAAALYSPVVHTMALLSFLGWLFLTGDWHVSVTIAIAVLIITCPCALGLAVPIVQVVAARRLFERGIMVKDGSALERMAEIDGVAFDKTGTLTLGRPALVNADRDPAVGDANRLGNDHRLPPSGGEGDRGGSRPRHGPRSWRSTRSRRFRALGSKPSGTVTGIGSADRNGRFMEGIMSTARPRPCQSWQGMVNCSRFSSWRTASGPMRERRWRNWCVRDWRWKILSGDREAVVEDLASKLGIQRPHGGAPAGREGGPGRGARRRGPEGPDGRRRAERRARPVGRPCVHGSRHGGGHRPERRRLRVPERKPLRRRRRPWDRAAVQGLIFQNFALAVGYNALAVPVAVLGYVTPLVAAVAMSLSSIIVVANAMRLPSARKAA